MKDLKDKIIEQLSLGKLTKELAFELIKGLQDHNEKKEEGIAIIGMAGRFPDAENLSEFWENLKSGHCSIKPFPQDRRQDTDPHLPREVLTKNIDPYLPGGYLTDVDKLDAEFFRISPREAQLMDPYQRLFLEQAYVAIEDAGYGGNALHGTKTGIYVGRNFTDGLFYKEVMAKADPLAVTGLATSVLASRIAYILNLKGPAVVLDAACSSALVSVHLACQALKEGECDTAIAGGIGLSLLPAVSTAVGIDSPDARVRAFDKDANGTVWGEGVGVLILKTLSKAIKDRDRIYAVIKGSSVNNNGVSSGISAPNAEALEEVILNAWTNAKINPEAITYIEAHGAGTPLGDAMEVKALTAAFNRHTIKKQFCLIGSLKPNIGHLVGASGIAGLIKVILAIKHRLIPASLNYREPNPHITFNESPVDVVTKLTPWENVPEPKTAGVISFGFNGTNCHIIIEAYQANSVHESDDYQLCKLSAGSEQGLLNLVKAYQEFLHKNESANFLNLCYTANTGRGDYRHRIGIVARNMDELKEKMALFADSGFTAAKAEKGIYYGEHRIIGYREAANPGELSEAEKLTLNATAAGVVNNIGVWKSQNDKRLKEAYEQLALLYVKGADLVWTDLYREENVRKTTLPSYPFERKRYWLDEKNEQNSSKADFQANTTPLLERKFKTPETEIYLTDLQVCNHWVVQEHRLMGVSVVPGVAYLEMMAEAAWKYSQGRGLLLQNVLFIIPLIVPDNETEQLQCVVKKDGDVLEFAAVSALSKSDEGLDTEWVYHATGKIGFFTTGEDRWYEIPAIRERCPKIKQISPHEYNIKGVYEMGPRWLNIKSVRLGDQEALGYLELGGEFKTDLANYYFHPALADVSLWVGHQLLAQSAEYLPLSFKSIRIYAPLPGQLYSYAKKVDGDDGAETIAFDVVILDTSGKVLVEIDKYRIKKINQADLKSNQILALIDKRRKLSGKTKKLTSLVIKEDDGSLSDVEKRVANIWAEALGLEEISIYDNIYDLGGDSIIGITIGSKLSKEFNIDFPLEEIFKHPTIADLSKLIPDLVLVPKVEFFRVERRRKEK